MSVAPLAHALEGRVNSRPGAKRRGWLGILRRTLKESAADRITSSAASVAFHCFLAIFPAAVASIAIVGLAGLSGNQLSSLLHGVSVLLPSQTSSVLNQELHSSARGTGSVFAAAAGVVVALWSCIEAMASLQVSLDVAYEVDRDRGFLGRRLMALPLLGLTIVLGGGASCLLVLGDPIQHLLLPSVAIVHPVLGAAWWFLRWVGATLLFVLLLSSYYSFGPKRSTARWEWVSWGAVAAVGGWLGASVLFSFYLDHFGHESRTYGAVAGVAILLLWLFLTATAVLLGAELNCELARDQTGAKAPKEAGPGKSDVTAGVTG